MRLPAPGTTSVDVRYAPLSARDRFDPSSWATSRLVPSPSKPGWVEIDLESLGLPDGEYEHEFIIDGHTDRPVPDPYAHEITRFGGYRGTFLIVGGQRVPRPFSWADELDPNRPLRNNNEMVIYEMPLRWMSSAPEDARQVDLGTFETIIFEHLDELSDLGISAIELLPIQDSPDTLNWGYGTRFFVAPDFDMGSVMDLKFFIKCCHRKGIRVILDVVMNHAAMSCPLMAFAFDWFFLPDGSQEEGDRPSWGGRPFRYIRPAPDGSVPAREFHYQMADYWIREYHVDGFRLDEFQGINNWDFIQTFRDRSWAAHTQLFPDRPFVVIAEDSWRRAEITQDLAGNPHGRKVVDGMWNFAFRDEIRRLMRNEISTAYGEPSRTDRVRALIAGARMWDDLSKGFKRGFTDTAQPVNYVTSHDVEKEIEERLMNYFLSPLLRQAQLDGSVSGIRSLFAQPFNQWPVAAQSAHGVALERVRSAFALMLTSVGVPMFLAGEEFGDVHDLENSDWRLKMSDPVDWARRRDVAGHQSLWDRVRELVHLRGKAPSLHRNEIQFLSFHPAFDANEGIRVFAFCRTDGRTVGSAGQVVVIANCGPDNFPSYDLAWPWPGHSALREIAAPVNASAPQAHPTEPRLTLSLGAFQVRVFET